MTAGTELQSSGAHQRAVQPRVAADGACAPLLNARSLGGLAVCVMSIVQDFTVHVELYVSLHGLSRQSDNLCRSGYVSAILCKSPR